MGADFGFNSQRLYNLLSGQVVMLSQEITNKGDFPDALAKGQLVLAKVLLENYCGCKVIDGNVTPFNSEP